MGMNQRRKLSQLQPSEIFGKIKDLLFQSSILRVKGTNFLRKFPVIIFAPFFSKYCVVTS